MSEIQRAAVGRLGKIGDLYDAVTDNFVGKSLLKRCLKDSAINVSPQSDAPSVQLVKMKSLDRKMSRLNIDHELRASILLDMVRVKGSGCFLKFFEESFEKSLVYSVIKKVQSFDLVKNSDIIDCYALNQHTCNAPRATHVVVGIKWGAVCCIASKLGPESEIKHGLKKIEKALNGESASRNTDAQPKGGDLARFRFFSDIPLEDNDRLVTVKEAVELADVVRNGTCVPVQFHLLPLEDVIERCQLQVSMKPSFKELDDEDFVDDLTKHLEELQIKLTEVTLCRDKMEDFATIVNDKSLHDVSEIWRELSDGNVSCIKELEETVVRKRRGEEPGETEDCDGLLKKLQSNYQEYRHEFNKELFRRDFEMIKYIEMCNKERVKCTAKGEKVVVNRFPEVFVLYKSASHTNTKRENFFFRFRKSNLEDETRHFVVVHEYVTNSMKKEVIEVYRGGQLVYDDYFEREGADSDICLVKLHKYERTVSKQMASPRAHLYIQCPNYLCPNKAKLWRCSYCKEVVEYGMRDEMFHCKCGIAKPSESNFRCNRKEHHLSYVSYDPTRLGEELSGLKQVSEVNILLLGESGVGKSTWVNSVYNYWTFDTLNEAMQSEELQYLVPFRFQHTESITIQAGQSSEDENLQAAASQTQTPKTYTFYLPDRKIRLIDTPGINDTEGAAKDETNVLKILCHLSSFEKLHSVCILFKAGQSRMNGPFKKCVKELLSKLHEDAVDNLAFIITHARYGETSACGSNEAATRVSLNTCLAEIGKGLEAAEDNTFYFDNDVFKFLASICNPDVLRSSFNVKEIERTWNMVKDQVKGLLTYIEDLTPHEVGKTMSLNERRATVSGMCSTLGVLVSTIQDNISLVEKKREQIKRKSDKSIEDLRQMLHYHGLDVKMERLPHRIVVCTHYKCVTRTDRGPGLANDDCYTTVCHDPCDCLNLNAPSGVNFRGLALVCNRLRYFLAFRQQCWCSHYYWDHMPLDYKHTTIKKSFIKEDVQTQILEEESSVEEKFKKVQHQYDKIVQELEMEKEEILKGLVVISMFLEDSSLVKIEDPVECVLDRMIQEESRQGDDVKKRNRMERLQENYLEMRQKARQEKSSSKTTDKDVMHAVTKLFGLDEFGKNVKESYDNASKTYHKNDLRGPEIPVYMLQ